MNKIEEQLWNYIDGNCTATEKTEIEAKIASNLQYSTMYNELMAVHNELNLLGFEEPSMSFTRNVMEHVNLELKPVALKTKVDNRIIYSIGAFFGLAILGIFIYAISITKMDFDFKMPTIDFHLDKLVTSTSIQVFLMVDIALALVYLDSCLRKGRINAQKKGS